MFCFASSVPNYITRNMCCWQGGVSIFSAICKFHYPVDRLKYFLLLLLILSVPLFWIVLPFASAVAKSSFVLFTMSALALSFTIWSLNCIPLNLIAVIAFLPFLFSLFATFFSMLAMIGRNWIHSFISAVLLRCAERSPLLVIGGGFGLVLAIIVILANVMIKVF